MLVLTRRQGEKVTLRHEDGTEIVLTVNDVKAGKVRLGIEAPQRVRVRRNELPESAGVGESRS